MLSVWGKVKYYDGALGYEAMVCQKCGHHYAELSKEEYDLNKRMFMMMKKKGKK